MLNIKRHCIYIFLLALFFFIISCDKEEKKQDLPTLPTLSLGDLSNYTAVRLNNKNPIITKSVFDGLGVPNEGENINGPSVIRIPDWITPENRADPNAQYYLYFAHHKGKYIRLAWSSHIEGPWTLYNTGEGIIIGERGVLDLGEDGIELDSNIYLLNDHIVSPDVHVDNDNNRIILYFHNSKAIINNILDKRQLTLVSTSENGLDFKEGIIPVMLGDSYFRVFSYQGKLYALANGGWMYQPNKHDFPWGIPTGFNFNKTLWEKTSKNLFYKDIKESGISIDRLRIRHTSVRVINDELHVFYSRRGDSPERIQESTIKLTEDWNNWDPSFPQKEVLRATTGWEGWNFTPKASETGISPENVNQLRDPYVFADIDSSLYLFYTGQGEDAIGVAQLFYNNTDTTSN